MKRLMMSLASVLVALLVGCESGELGMKIKITEEPVPASVPEIGAEAQSGKLKIAITGEANEANKALVDSIATAFTAHSVPEGELTFSSWSLRTPSMEYPPRASVEISCICIFKETGNKAVCYNVALSTFSIEIEDREKQMKYLRDEAIKGLVRELADEF